MCRRRSSPDDWPGGHRHPAGTCGAGPRFTPTTSCRPPREPTSTSSSRATPSSCGSSSRPSAAAESARVLLRGEVPPPRGVHAGLVGLLVGDLGVEARGGGTVPVVLARLEVDAVPRPHLLDRPALALAEADPLGDEDRLP